MPTSIYMFTTVEYVFCGRVPDKDFRWLISQVSMDNFTIYIYCPAYIVLT
jgi:hypothetical protein